MNERDLEQLLTRYRPADPAVTLDARIARLVVAPALRETRVWPWAAAAAALLAITLALHAPAPPNASTREAVPDPLIQQLGGDAAAADLVRVMRAMSPPELPASLPAELPPLETR